MRRQWIIALNIFSSAAWAQTTAPVAVDSSAPDRLPDRSAATTEVREALEGAVDANTYLVGPGDRFLVELWGLHDLNMEVEVNAEGRLSIPKVGVFPAQRETLVALRRTVEQRLKVVYPSLRGGLTLIRPRTFRVHVVGAVAHPGSYTATPVTRVSDLVARAGGPLPRASLRVVQVRRSGGAQQLARITADLLRFALLGQSDGDPTVLDGDTVFVPLREVDVEITGAVKRPGHYELIGDRKGGELLELAGGVSADAAHGMPIRWSSHGDDDHLLVRSITLADFERTAFRDGDRVHVPAQSDLRRSVVVEGAVVGTTPLAAEQRAPYLVDRRADAPVSGPRDISVAVAFVDGDGVRDVINKVGGLQPWADPQVAYLLRPGGSGSRQRLAVDISAISDGRAPEVPVAAGDTLVVPSRREQVMVGGAVQHPGLYQYNPELRPHDYLALAGGPTRSGNVDETRVLRHAGGGKKLKDLQSIEPGDSITVPERRFTAAELIEITLILGNLAVATTALALSQR